MVKPLFSILHTSARPNQWRMIYDAWLGAARHPEWVEYVLCVDERWGFPNSEQVGQRLGNSFWELRGADAKLNCLVWNHGRRCYVDGVNTAAKAATGCVLVVNADDQYPCDGWDEALAYEVMRWDQVRMVERQAAASEPVYSGDGFFTPVGSEYLRDALTACAQDTDFVVEVSTGTPREHNRGIMVMPILSRARYDRLGYVFYPEYESMFADNEFCEHARQDDVVVDARHLLFPHRHPTFIDGKFRPLKPEDPDWDAQYLAQNRPEAYAIGERILKYRQRIGFGAALDAAERIQGWMTRAELEWLSRAAFEAGSVIEVGCWKGRSTVALAAGCPGPVHAVDTWRGSAELPEMQRECADDAVYREFQANVGPLVHIHRGDSVAQAAGLPDAGMVFLDGGHTYEQKKADLLAYMPKATRLICGHDFPDPQVKRAVVELLGDPQIVPGTRLWYYRLPQGQQFEVKPRKEQRVIALMISGETFHWEWVQALRNLDRYFERRGFQVWNGREYTSNVYVTREQLRKVMKDLDPKPDLFFWFDDDNPVPTPEQFELLLNGLDEHPEIDGISGWCWIYNTDTGHFYPSCGMWAPDGMHWRAFDPVFFPLETQPRVLECSGFPCFLMRRSALDKAGHRPFLPFIDESYDQGLSGEDLAFCMRAQAGGAVFMVDPRVRVRHLKTSDAIPAVPPGAANLPEPTIAVMMRVKNEARWIDRCINSVIPLAGENVFVLDDESTDDTLEIARGLGVNVYRDPFPGEPLDEPRDKEWLLTQVKAACDPDWILCIDGDEELEPDGAEMIRRVLKTNPDVDVFALNFLFLWDTVDQIRVDGRFASLGRESLFRAKGTAIHFRSYYQENETGPNAADPKCHVGLHCGNAPVSDGRKKPINVNLLHYGYILRDDRIRKYRWYRSIDPDNPYEDNYRHIVLGDLPEFPASMTCALGGPLKLIKLTRRMVPQFTRPLEPLRDTPRLALVPPQEVTA